MLTCPPGGMLDVLTYCSGFQEWMQRDYLQGVLQEKTSGVMWIRTYGQMEKTRLSRTVIFLYLSYTTGMTNLFPTKSHINFENTLHVSC